MADNFDNSLNDRVFFNHSNSVTTKSTTYTRIQLINYLRE